MKNIQINESITFHSCEAWSKNPQALKVICVPSLLDWHVRKFIFAIQASFKNSNPTLRLLSMDYRPPLLSIVWKTFNQKMWEGTQDSEESRITVHVPYLQGPVISNFYCYDWNIIWSLESINKKCLFPDMGYDSGNLNN